MTEQTGQAPPQPVTIPAGIALDDLIEAVSRGVAQALAAQDDVSGYSFGSVQTPPLVLTMVILCPTFPPQDPRRPSGRIVERVSERSAR